MKKLVLAVSLIAVCSQPAMASIGKAHTVKAVHHKHATTAQHKPTAQHKKHGLHQVQHSKKHSTHGSGNTTVASYYSNRFHGKPTSSGEVYDMNKLTAAHRSLPLRSYARVTNLSNHRSVVVRINDRGSFHGRRGMDLSRAAAKEIGLNGLAAVEITPLGFD